MELENTLESPLDCKEIHCKADSQPLDQQGSLWVLLYEQSLRCVFLSLVGLDAGKIKLVGVICGQESTRRIGDYKVKYGYTDIDLLR